jgi:hypothetical protein
MTRIGFAYNQKPVPSEISEIEPSDDSRDDEEPPSTRRDDQSRNSLSPASASSDARLAASTDRFAEWDGPETLDAVADALSALGKVIRLEADDDFPAKLRAARPDIVFNIA